MIRTVAELQTAQYLDCKPRQQVNNLVTISQCEEKDFIEKQTDCALVGILIQIRHNSFTNDERRQLVTTGSRYASGMNSGQRQRLGGGNRNYDRLALFADTRGNGRCFAIIFKNSTASTIFFRRCIRTQEGVGNIFFLDEPTAVISTLGSTPSVPIIESVLETIPLCNPINTIIPAVPLEAPNMGCTRYFSSHNITDVKFLSPRFVESICLGSFCDRQLSTENLVSTLNARCGCFHQDRSTSPLLVEFDIALSCPFTFDQSGKTYITNFRSYRTTLLFIKKESLKLVQNGSNKHLQDLRIAVENIVNYINRNGGWSYVGWLRTGIVHDISETQAAQAENLASTSQTPHLSYLYPTNDTTITEENVNYVNLIMNIHPIDDGENVIESQE